MRVVPQEGRHVELEELCQPRGCPEPVAPPSASGSRLLSLHSSPFSLRPAFIFLGCCWL